MGVLNHILDLITAVQNLTVSDFEDKARSFDAGQYRYYIDENFLPIQDPGVSLGYLSKTTNYEDHWAMFFDSKYINKYANTYGFEI